MRSEAPTPGGDHTFANAHYSMQSRAAVETRFANCRLRPLGVDLQRMGNCELAIGERLALHRRMRIVLAAVVAALIGCTAEQAPVGYPAGLAPLPSLDGYTVESRVVVALGAADVDGAIAQLQAFSLHGGTTLLAQSADTPAGQVLAAIPSTLRAKLDGWIDTELDKQKLGTATARQAVGDIAVMAQSVTTGFMLESSLTITPTGASHTLQDLNFQPDSMDVVVPIGGLMADKLEQQTTATVSEGGAVVLGDQRFGLALGSHAWQGLGLAVQAKYGVELTAVQQIDCNAVAQAVAARCISSTCVGHASDLVTICQQGMTGLVDRMRDSLTPITLSTLRFVDGNAKLIDDNRDGVAEKLSGTWDVQIDVGAGAHTSQSAFTGFN